MMVMGIRPPIFVQYPNSGVVAFKSVDQALAKVRGRDLERIAGVWDSAGQRLHYERGMAGVEIVLVDSGDWRGLRTALVERLLQDGDDDLDGLDDETLVFRANQRLRLRSRFEIFSEAIRRTEGEGG